MRPIVFAVASTALVLAGCGGATNTASTQTTTVTSLVTVTVTATESASTMAPAPAPAPAPVSDTIPGVGTFRVGADVQPGTYTSTPSRSGFNCWGYRLSALSHTPASQLEVQYGEGPVYITILPSDVAFKSEGCTTWQKVS
jgi:hypothetical protein